MNSIWLPALCNTFLILCVLLDFFGCLYSPKVAFIWHFALKLDEKYSNIQLK